MIVQLKVSPARCFQPSSPRRSFSYRSSAIYTSLPAHELSRARALPDSVTGRIILKLLGRRHRCQRAVAALNLLVLRVIDQHVR